MSASKASPAQQIVGAAAAIVLIARARDARHISRLFVDPGSVNPVKILTIWASALTIFGYEKLIGALLRAMGSKLPSTLMAQITLFGLLRAIQNIFGRAAGDRVSSIFKPGVEFLGKWMGLFLAPPLVALDASIARLPAYEAGVWGRAVALLGGCWTAQHAVGGVVSSAMVKGRTLPALKAGTTNGSASSAPATTTTAVAKPDTDVVPQDEAVRRAWVFLGAVGYLGVCAFPVLPPALHRPFGMLCELCTTIGAFSHAKLLPEMAQRVLHPIVVCSVTSNLCTRLVGDAAPYFDQGYGVGDMLFKWLPPAVVGLGVRMYQNTPLWLDKTEDFRVVLVTCGASGVFNLVMMMFGAVSDKSPMGVPPPLSLPLVNRSVMSVLGIASSEAIGPECDPKLAVASILITGCIGASLGNAMLYAVPAVFQADWPLVRGIAMGCSAHSIGTAGLISEADSEAAAISGACMCIHGAVHTALMAVPGVVPTIRSLARLS